MPRREDCLDDILKRAGGRRSRADAEKLLSDLDGAAEARSRMGDTAGEAYTRARDKVNDEFARRAALRRREARMNTAKLIREQRRIDDLRKNQGISPRLTAESITVGVNTPFYRSRDSISAMWHVLTDKYTGKNGVIGALRREGLLKVVASLKIDQDIGREMFELDKGEEGRPGITKNPQAKRAAEIFHAADKQAIEDHNRAGGWIRSYFGHAAKSLWDADAIRTAGSGGNKRRLVQDELNPFGPKGGLEADRFAFIADFMKHLDLGRTFGKMDAQAIRDALYEMWVPLKNGDHFDYASPTEDPTYPNVAGKAAAHRELHFKSFDDWYALNQKYGLYPTFLASKMEGYRTLARQTALVSRLGTKPEEAFEDVVSWIKKGTEATNQRQEFEKFEPMLRKQFNQFTGKNNRPVYKLAARIAGNWMVWERMSMLGRVLITHLEGLPTKSSELRYWGASFADRYKGFFTDMMRAAEGTDRAKLAELIWAGADADNSYLASRYDSADTPKGVFSRIHDTFFWLTGVTNVLPNQREGAQLVMARELGMERGKAWAEVDPKLQRILRMYGIEEPEWKALSGVDWQVGRASEGSAAYLTPTEALKLSDEQVRAYLAERRPPLSAHGPPTADMIEQARHDLATTLATMYSDRGDYAMFRPSERTRARLYGNTQAGTAGNIALRLLWQFKQWPLEMIYRTWGREIYGGNRGMDRVAAVTELLVASTVMGVLGEMVRDVTKGQNPLPRAAAHPVEYVTHGFLRSGAGTIAGDYLFGEFDRHWRSALASIAGPTFGQVDDIMDLLHGGGPQERHPWKERAADLVRLLKTNGGPIVNFWATSWAFEYLFMYRLQEWLHPGYVERYERKMRDERGVDFLVRPTAMTPH
jgi:hypothetical protein